MNQYKHPIESAHGFSTDIYLSAVVQLGVRFSCFLEAILQVKDFISRVSWKIERTESVQISMFTLLLLTKSSGMDETSCAVNQQDCYGRNTQQYCGSATDIGL